jgi:DNA sulfur modification protein DndC
MSVFDNKTVNDIYAEIQTVYLSDSRPWIIGFSGGKDSTTALQLVWNAIAQLQQQKRTKPIYVISTDTLVETPVIIDYIEQTLSRIDENAKRQKLPIKTFRLKPLVTDTFWVNLIGKGYPAPQQKFRWCTERMKIRPADRFITEKVSKHGEVVLILGVRKSESMTRAQVMSLYKIKDSVLSRHSKFSGAFVYTPIEDFSVDDVWTYLLQTPCPWGNNNRDLLALYTTASQTKECPIVVDEKTPSCGNSRFGCWVCTVVTRDKTMESLIDSGEDWMQPLLEIRDLLSSTQDPDQKHLFREYKRRNGRVDFKSNGTPVISRGPYKFEFRKDLLRKLLEAQVKIQKTHDKKTELILPEELHEIRRLWKLEKSDWNDSVPKIYKEVTGKEIDWTDDDVGQFSEKDSALLEKICKKHEVPVLLVKKLLDAEFQTQGMNRRSSIYTTIERVLKEEWRSEEEVIKERLPS